MSSEFDLENLVRILITASEACARSGADALWSVLDTISSGTNAEGASVFLCTSAPIVRHSQGVSIKAPSMDMCASLMTEGKAVSISLSESDNRTIIYLGLGSNARHLGVVGFSFDTKQRANDAIATLKSTVHIIALALREVLEHDEACATKDATERRVREMATIYDIGKAIDQCETDELLDIVTEKAALVMDAQACSLLLRTPDTNALVIAASFGLPDEVVENTRVFVGEGIAGRVVQSGEALLLHSLDDEPLFEKGFVSGVPNVGSSVSVPMRDGDGQIQGVLCIRRNGVAERFTDEDLRLFNIFANQASMAINNRRLYSRLSNKLHELSTLASLTESIISSLDLGRVLNQVADGIVDVVHFDLCRIYLSDPDTGRFSASIVRGFPADSVGANDANIGIGEDVVGLVAQSQQPMLIDNLETANSVVRRFAKSLGLKSFYAQPIVARERCIGVVVVSSTSAFRTFAPNRIEVLSTFVHQAGIAIENARFYTSQEKRYSELTTLYEVSRSLSATSGVFEAARSVTELATKITDSDAGVLLMFDAVSDSMRALHWCGLHDELDSQIKSYTVPTSTSYSARTLRIPRVLNASDIENLFGPPWRLLSEGFVVHHRSVALVPLVVSGESVGFLILGKHHADYGVEQLRLIAVASSQAAAVLSSAFKYEQSIGQRELELSAVYDLMQRLRTAKNLEQALDSILGIVGSLVWSDRSMLLTIDDNNETMTVRAARGEDSGALIGKASVPLNSSNVASRALRDRTATISSDPAGDIDNLRAIIPGYRGRTEIRSVLAIPLVVGDDPIGALLLESSKVGEYTSDSARTLHLVSSQAATIYREMSSLRTLTRYTENILRSIAAGVITVDKNGVIVTWNARAEEIINLQAHEIIGRHYSEFIEMLQVDAPMREETMKMVELTAKTGKVFTRNQLCYQSPQGDETYVNLSASQLKSESGEYLGVVVVFEDITNEMQMKEEVERVSKLAETGQLAANIAHELRNPLSSIKGAAQFLRNELPPDYIEQHGEFFEIIIEEVNGLNRMTSEFLDFSRVTPPSMRMIDLNALVSRMLHLMGPYLTNQSVSVVDQLEDALPEVLVDRNQIEQVVKNIVINSAQAMPNGGQLNVTTRHLKAQDIVEVEFSDTGVGISPDKMDKIWTPFFTTKTKGTGLGLAIVLKIVETHGGHMSLKSSPGRGSVFTMQLPVKPNNMLSIPQARTEITEQRSDQPGGIFEPSLLESS